MSVIDQALKSNGPYAKAYDPRLGAHPQPAIAVVTCMDHRLSDLEGILGLKRADMDVIRNGGPGHGRSAGRSLSFRREFWGRRRSCFLTTPAADLRPLPTRN
jgi:carbonic anhydrase